MNQQPIGKPYLTNFYCGCGCSFYLEGIVFNMSCPTCDETCAGVSRPDDRPILSPQDDIIFGINEILT